MFYTWNEGVHVVLVWSFDHVFTLCLLCELRGRMQPRKLQCCIWRDSIKPSLRFSWFCVFFISKGFLSFISVIFAWNAMFCIDSGYFMKSSPFTAIHRSFWNCADVLYMEWMSEWTFYMFSWLLLFPYCFDLIEWKYNRQ